jgi:polysaccharide biosynthesis transport protein
MASVVQLMESAEVLLPVIERLHLTQDAHYTAGYRGDRSSLAEYVKENLLKDLEFESGRGGSQLIYVTASARDPILAAQIANTLVDTYLNQESQRRSGPESDRAKRYAQELTELKSKVNAAQDQVTAFRQKAGVTDVTARNSNVQADLLTSLETRLQEAQNARRAAEVKAAEDQRVTSGAAASVTIQSVRSQLNIEKAQLAQMRATMGVQHPKVIELQNQIDANQRILDSEFNTYAAGASSDLTAARQLEAKLQAAVAEQRSKALSVSRMEDEGTKYVLELESAQAVYKRALEGYDQIMFASGARATNMNLVSQAVPQLNATKPDKVKLLLVGLAVGILLGLLGPMGYELIFNRRIRCRDDFERGFAIPVLMEFDAIPAARVAI